MRQEQPRMDPFIRDPVDVMKQIGRDQVAHASRRRRCTACYGKSPDRIWRPGDCWYDPQYDLDCPRCENTGWEGDRP